MDKKLEEAHDKMTEAYNEWARCQNLPRRPGYAMECREAYDNFSKLLHKYNTLLNNPKHSAFLEFTEFQKSVKSEPTKKRKIPKFPETVVLGLTIHGSYYVKSDGSDIVYFDLPPGVTLRTITAAPIGVCNFPDPKLLNKQIEELIGENNEVFQPLIDACKESDSCDEMLDWITERFANFLRRTEQSNLKELATAEKDSHTDKRNDLSLYRANEIFHINKHLDSAPTKGFSVSEKDILRGGKEHYDWTITIVNMPKAPNLLDDVWFSLPKREINHGKKGLTLSVEMPDIIKYLSDHGAKNIIFIDFSCSGFNDTLHPVTKSRIIASHQGTRHLRKRASPSKKTKSRGGRRKKSSSV